MYVIWYISAIIWTISAAVQWFGNDGQLDIIQGNTSFAIAVASLIFAHILDNNED
jgi:hypothetical protein